jgi:hypothetical protein
LNEPIILAQTLDAPSPVDQALGSADKIHSQCELEQRDQGVIAEAAIA